MSLLDAFKPGTRRDTADYGIDEPIMDGPYGDAANHAGRSWLTADDGEDYGETLSAELARIARSITR